MLNRIFKHINNNNSNHALCIDGFFYSYSDLYTRAAQIYKLINKSSHNENSVGVVLSNDLNTFASIIAIWASNNSLLLLDSEKNYEFNYNLVQKTKCSLVLNSNDIIFDSVDLSDLVEIILTNEIFDDEFNDINFKINLQSEFYFSLINDYYNVNELIQYKWNDVEISLNSCSEFNFKLNSSDKFISFFDFTHPLSIFTFLLSLSNGGCFYTIPTKVNRAFTTYSMIDEYQITFSFTTPYAIQQLEPFFEDIALWSLKYLFIVGDLLIDKSAKSIINCASNAYIFNAGYSPYIFGLFSFYEIDNIDDVLNHDNFTSIGKPLNGFSVRVLNYKNDELRPGEIGELVLKNNNINYTSFYNFENKLLDDTIGDDYYLLHDDFKYRTGIIGFINDQGMIMPTSSIYKQFVIDNIPLNLSTLEKNTRNFLKSNDVVSVIYKNIVGYNEIHLFVQNLSIDQNELFYQLKSKLPEYLLPIQIHNINSIPIDDNCLYDLKKLLKTLEDNENSFRI